MLCLPWVFLHQQLSLRVRIHLLDFLRNKIWHLHQIADGHIFLQSTIFYSLVLSPQKFSENQKILPSTTMLPIVLWHSSLVSQVPPMVSHSGSWKIETIHYLSGKLSISILIENLLLNYVRDEWFNQVIFRNLSKVAHNRHRHFYFTVQPRPQPTAQNWFFMLGNLRTRHLFSYLCTKPYLISFFCYQSWRELRDTNQTQNYYGFHFDARSLTIESNMKELDNLSLYL